MLFLLVGFSQLWHMAVCGTFKLCLWFW